MLRPQHGNSSGLPIVLLGMPSISARGIVTGTAGGGKERRAIPRGAFALTTRPLCRPV